MSTVEEHKIQHFEIIDHDVHQMSGYVTYIVDIWRGDRNDLATDIDRYIGVFRGEDLEKPDGEAFDPDFLAGDGYRMRPTPKPLVWERAEEIKRGDHEAQMFQAQYNAQTDTEAYAYGARRQDKEYYTAFLAAIDVLSEDENNKEAWAIVDAYRERQAHQHEK